MNISLVTKIVHATFTFCSELANKQGSLISKVQRNWCFLYPSGKTLISLGDDCQPGWTVSAKLNGRSSPLLGVSEGSHPRLRGRGFGFREIFGK